MIQVLVASRNRHKIQEIRQMLGESCHVRGLEEVVDGPVLIEDAASFSGNATRKAWQLVEWLLAEPGQLESWDGRTPLVVLADDSGLEVDILDGAPGVHSARFANLDTTTTGNASDAANNKLLLRLLESVPVERRTARFRCVLAAIELRPVQTGLGSGWTRLEPGPARCYEGVCEGRIGFASRGENGFGYDPLFVPEGEDMTFAELGGEQKNQLSHRFRALERVKTWLLTL
jgi:XTP/dITP diphosphohydrolase